MPPKRRESLSCNEPSKTRKNRALRNMKKQGIFQYDAKILKTKDVNDDSKKNCNGNDMDLAMCSLGLY